MPDHVAETLDDVSYARQIRPRRRLRQNYIVKNINYIISSNIFAPSTAQKHFPVKPVLMNALKIFPWFALKHMHYAAGYVLSSDVCVEPAVHNLYIVMKYCIDSVLIRCMSQAPAFSDPVNSEREEVSALAYAVKVHHQHSSIDIVFWSSAVEEYAHFFLKETIIFFDTRQVHSTVYSFTAVIESPEFSYIHVHQNIAVEIYDIFHIKHNIRNKEPVHSSDSPLLRGFEDFAAEVFSMFGDIKQI